jgi:flagellar FliL protein
MAEENEAQEQQTSEEAPKKKKTKILLLIPVVLILLIGMVVGGAKMGFINLPGLAAKKGEGDQEGIARARNAESSVGIIYPMKPFIVNLADDTGGRYLKVKFEMELNDEKLVPEIEKRMPQLTDSVIMLLSSKTYKEIQNYEGKDRMRNEITLRLNSFLREGFIRRIYFTEFVMQ